MSDWIARLKSADDEAVSKRQSETNLRLHRARVIAAKAPAFWDQLVVCVESDCETLRSTFPDDVIRHCVVSRHGASSIELRGNKEPFQTLRLTLNIPGMTLDQELVSGSRKQGNESKKSSSLRFEVDGSEALSVKEDVYFFGNPEPLAEMLIKRACLIKD